MDQTAVVVAVLVACGLGSAGIGCYNPKIQDGGFRCSPVFVQECPEGFTCDHRTSLCRKGARLDSGVDVPVEKAPSPDVPAEMPMEHPSEKPECLKPVAGCTADAGTTCDPQCQTGCGCQEKCSVNTDAAMTCNGPNGSFRWKVGQGCDISSAGTAQQADNCEPGLICLVDSCDRRCYKFCRSDQDCPNSSCSHDVGGVAKVCDVPSTVCNPVGNSGGSTSCPSPDQGCYLSSTVPDRTVCDCPFNAVKENEACAISRDCLPGLVCVNAGGGLRCRRACSLAGPGASGCAVGGTCTKLNDGKMYGFCN